MSDKLPIFFHVPRTGGTSLRETLLSYYGPERVYLYYHPKTRPFVSDEESERAKCFYGHLVYYGMPVNRPCQYITFVREPFERMQSLFNYVRVLRQHQYGVPATFDEWFPSCRSVTMTLVFADTLFDAKKVLKSCSFIGTQETYAEDISKLLLVPNIDHHYNGIEEITQKCGIEEVKFTEEQSQRIRPFLKEDEELYRYALDIRSGINRGFVPLSPNA